MATFSEPKDSVKAAIEILDEIEGFNHRMNSKDIILKIGLHRGASIAVTLNERLDYFGQTVNIASRVQGLADSNEIYLSKEVFESTGVKEIVDSHSWEASRAKLKGLRDEVDVYKITFQKMPAEAVL